MTFNSTSTLRNMPLRRTLRVRQACAAAWLVAMASVAQAQSPASGPIQGPSHDVPPAHILNLSATASVEAPQDVLIVVYGITREGNDAQSVQSALKQALDAALAEARKAAKPGQVDVSTGGFRLTPRYGPKSQITGWQGSAELITQGKDTAALAQLSGRITTMTISRVAYDLSRETRLRVESEATAQAIALFRAQAADMSRAFGYGGYTIRDVHVNTASPPRGGAAVMMQSRASMADAAEALPTEAGKSLVTANVTGAVQMTK